MSWDKGGEEASFQDSCIQFDKTQLLWHLRRIRLFQDEEKETLTALSSADLSDWMRDWLKVQLAWVRERQAWHRGMRDLEIKSLILYGGLYNGDEDELHG